MRIDAHQHFWRLDRGDYGWLTAADHPAIFRDFGPQDLAPRLAEAGIERTILVQAAPTSAETDWLLEVAGQTDFVAGVVGWADLAAADAPAVIEDLARRPALVGLRPMLQDLADDDWILGPAVGRALDAMQACGLRFDVLVQPRHLPHLQRLVDVRPDLPLVIDHGAKPRIAEGRFNDWAAAMRRIAASSGACCKLSGLVTEGGRDWSDVRLRPYVDLLLEAFGPSRLMWGSDWPVVLEAASYAVWRETAEKLAPHLSAGERDDVFGDTAARFYGLT
jgi:L-fuconolactonase